MDKNTIELFKSKKTDDWRTPPELYKELDQEFKFNSDPCPINPKFDGLKIDWEGSIYVNPPYSQVKTWLIKAHEELKKKANTIVFLTFANTDTAWFHDLVKDKAEIRFIRGRLRFLDREGKQTNSAMRPSMITIFKKKQEEEYYEK